MMQVKARFMSDERDKVGGLLQLKEFLPPIALCWV
jgi:hypothetical protein